MADIIITKEDGARHGRYVARIEGIDAEGESATQFGIRGDYLAMDNFTIGGRFDYLDIDAVDMSRLSLTTSYTAGGFEFTGEVGRAKVEASGLGSGSETFFGIGAKMSFGARGGTTFDKRGLAAVVPGL